MLEFEKKVILTEREYRFLTEYRYVRGRECVQINHYYDTEDFHWCSQGITCRIREKDGIFQSTVKQHYVKDHDGSVESSWAATVGWDDAEFRNMGLIYQGCLETTRKTCEVTPYLKIMLDKNRYLGVLDYELEMEYEPTFEREVMQEFDRMCEILYIHGIIESISDFKAGLGTGAHKSKRFFDVKRKIMQKEGKRYAINLG